MSKSQKGFGRAGLSALATSALVIGTCAAFVAPANADANFSFTRVDGHSRYDVSASVADRFGSASHVILASGEDGKFGDALAANYLAGVLNAPVLLTQLNTTPDVIKAAIAKTGAKDITVVGGPLSVSDAQVQALESDGYTVNRVAGHTRYDTDAAIIKQGATSGDTAIIATGEKFPDALSAGPLAFAKKLPVGLVTLGSAPQAVIDALKAQGVNKAIVLGGDLSISQETRQQLENNGIHIINQLNGANRAAVATQVADLEISAYGFKNDRVNVATGREFGTGADALSAGPLTGTQQRPLLITAGDPKVGTTQAIGQDLLNWLQAHARTLTGSDNLLFGGPLSISDAEKTAMEKAAQTVTSNQTYTVTPSGDQNVQPGTVQQYSVSGITAKSVTIQLFDCSDVTTSGQTTSFDGTNPGGTGNVATDSYNGHGPGGTDISVINGTATPGTGVKATGVTPQNGTVTFTVSGAAAGDCFVPVIYNDATGNGLDLAPNGQPTEAFGAAGQTAVLQKQAADASSPNGTVTQYSTTSDYIETNGDVSSTDATNPTYFYDSNDQFQVSTDGGTTYNTVSLADFQKALSQGDTLNGLIYRTNPADQSTFRLNDVAPGNPAVSLAKETDGKGGIAVTVTPAGTGDVVSYNVYRATATQPSVVGAPVTCPTLASGSYTKIGSLTDLTKPLTYDDRSASAPTAGSSPASPQYCYYATAVDRSGQESRPAAGDVKGPQEAGAVTAAAGAPKFTGASTATVGTAATNTVSVTYNEPVADSSIDANGSDYTVTATYGGATHAETVTAATPNSTAGAGANTTTVALTVTEPIPNGATVLVTAKQGADNNTVANTDATPLYQAVGDAVQTTAADTTPATFTPAAGGTTATFQASEPLDPATVSTTGADVTTTVNTATNPIVSESYNAATRTITVTFTNPPAAGKTVTLLAGSVNDAQGNPSPTNPVTAAF